MSGATRFLLLLSTAPLPRLRLHLPRPSFLPFTHRQNLSPATRRHHSLAPLRASQQFHSQTSDEHLGTSSHPHPWPHWSELLNNLSEAGYFHRHGIDWEDEFLSIEDLPDGFVRAANACLAFARERTDILGKLPRRDVEVVVENGIPFLFRNAEESGNRIRSFLCSEDSKVSVSDKGYMIDLMRFLLSYASSPIISSEKKSLYNIEPVESSVQNLLNELVKLSYSAPEPHKNQFLDEYGQTPKPLGESIEMKRGDWICPRCTFMNFARNVECRECQECRPKRQLTGGEWTCPQCDYYNHRKNLVCLRCDCKPQGRVSLGHTNSRSALGNNADVDSSRLAANEKEANRWLSKVSNLDGASDQTNSIVDEGFPEIMPLRKGVNRFVVSTRKTPLERRLADAQPSKSLDSDGFAQASDLQSEGVNNSNAISGQSAGVNSTSIPYRPTGGSDYVPFVPLPADRFAKKIERPKMEENKEAMMDGLRSVDSNSTEQTSALSGVKDPDRPGDSIQLSEKPVNQSESKDNGQEVAEKSARWFKRIAEVHNVDDLATAIPDGDFPEVMPMRKGENRFVVSNKKDRSLTSPMYKRRMAMEQTNSDHYVPFVPLPADYFAKKDKPQVDGPDRTDKGTSETSSLATQDKLSERPGEYRSTIINDNVKEIEKQPTSTRSKKTEAYYGEQTIGNQNSKGEWGGKSLEGSAVKETDPLDMSEEAKAERWFRRVAQIKDISELSQIPDEDFPSIMPMRKGVNRFVVSKRKTPLERRLTSPQYRKNLPIASSDPPNKENEGT